MSKRLSRVALVVFGLGLFGVFALALAGCGGNQYAQKHPERAYRYVSYRVDSVLDDLEATEKQRAEVHGVKDRVYDDIKAFGEHSKKTGRSAFAELKKDSPDQKKLHAMVDERMDEMRIKMHKLVDGLLEVHDTLSHEQRAELVAMIEERIGD